MTLNGKRNDFLTADLLTAANAADLKPAKAKTILRQVHKAITQWQNHAEIAGVFPDWIKQIQDHLRVDLKV
jgi:serine/threonine-protein kinase HipA